MPVHLSHVAYAVGTLTPLGDLRWKERIPRKVLAGLQGKGLARVSVDRRPVAALALDSIGATMAASGMAPDTIRAIVIANSNSWWSDENESGMLEALHRAGFAQATIASVSLQGCAVAETAIDLAATLAQRAGTAGQALLVVLGKAGKGSRLAPQNSTVYGDGAASAIVSLAPGEFERLASASSTQTDPVLAPGAKTGAPFASHKGLVDLRDVCAQVLREAGIRADEVEAVFGTNGSQAYLDVIALAAEVPPARVFRDNLASVGHVYACDNFASLSTYARAQRLRPGAAYLFVSWAPQTVSASVWRYLGGENV